MDIKRNQALNQLVQDILYSKNYVTLQILIYKTIYIYILSESKWVIEDIFVRMTCKNSLPDIMSDVK